MYKIVLLLINLRYKAVNDSQVQLFEWYWFTGSKTGSWMKGRAEYFKKILPFYTLSSDACRYLAHIYSGLHELCVCHAQTFGAKQALITH